VLGLLGVLGIPVAEGVARADAPTVIAVRHAEKREGDNPRLTTEGERRAKALVRVVEKAGVVAVYATEWCRTALTAEPAAAALGLEIHVQDNGRPGDQLAECGLGRPTVRLDPSVATAADLAEHLVAAHPQGAVLVVGHSNTVPALVEALGAPPLCPDYFPADDRDCHIPDEPPVSEYHHLFVVVRGPDGADLLRVSYGD
jgi:broad specificity phosphatase PhoE